AIREMVYGEPGFAQSARDELGDGRVVFDEQSTHDRIIPMAPRSTKISKTRGSDDAALSRWSALWRRAQLLRRPRHRVPELAGGAQREVRIAQQFPRHEHAVGLAARDDLVRLRRVCDQTHRTGRD